MLLKLPKRYRHQIRHYLTHISLALIFFTAPASTNYSLQEWGFGSAGTPDSESTNYQLHGISQESTAPQLESTNYKAGPGQEFQIMADVPPAPTLTNDARWYNKLKLVLDPGPNPSDTLFAIAISPDSFTTTYYVQSDNTIDTTLGSEDYQTYTSWGGATGISIIGLSPDTTYTVKARAIQGDFTETPWGPTDTAATQPPILSFDIDVSSSDTETSSPYNLAFGTLSTSGVNTASEYIWLDLDTNAEGGASVYVRGANAGLTSSSTSHTIDSVTANLAATSEGYGAQVTSVSETSDGPLVADSPFDGSSENVGILSSSLQPLVSSILNPITAGRGQVSLKASISDLTPAATDYTETLTLVAAATY